MRFTRPKLLRSFGRVSLNVMFVKKLKGNNMNIKIISSLFALAFFSCNAFASNLVKFYSNNESYFLVPTNRIMLFNIEKNDKEVVIAIESHGSILWKATIDNISEKEALKLVDDIYSVTRKEILNVKVNSFN